MELKAARNVPVSEWSALFMQKMMNGMGMSFFKYGPVRDNYPDPVDAVASLENALVGYKRTGNLDFLVDVANYAMIEHMRPSHDDAHTKAADTGRDARIWKKRK